LTEKDQTPCRGRLERIEQVMSGKVNMTCDTCSFQWDEFFRPGQQQAPKAPRWRHVPNELVEAFARAEFERAEMEHHPDPSDRRTWASLSAERTTRMNKARVVLGRCWVEFGTWFEDFLGVEVDSGRNVTARRALEEIAIPTLERYEEKFDTPDKPRVALEAILNARQEAA
jgi:hypothetical protein